MDPDKKEKGVWPAWPGSADAIVLVVRAIVIIVEAVLRGAGGAGS